jgi:molybdate transport system substrate-binding protein
LIVVSAATARAEELHVFAGGALKNVVSATAAVFEQQSGHKIAAKFGEPGALKREIESGAAFDVVVLDRAVVDGLIAGERVAADSRREIARVGMAVAVRQGHAKPNVGTVADFKKAVLEAKSISYAPEGATGAHLQNVFQALGISEEMKAKAQLHPIATRVAQAVADGEADLGFSVGTNFAANPKLEIAGLLPADLQYWVVFTTGIASKSQSPAAAKAFAEKLSSPEAAALLEAQGMLPIAPAK